MDASSSNLDSWVEFIADSEAWISELIEFRDCLLMQSRHLSLEQRAGSLVGVVERDAEMVLDMVRHARSMAEAIDSVGLSLERLRR